ncbi:MAG TPA: hypothetical protein VF691_22845 [Cytophagaceae bacterium]
MKNKSNVPLTRNTKIKVMDKTSSTSGKEEINRIFLYTIKT